MVTASPSDNAPSEVPSEAASDMFSNELPDGSAKKASCRWIDLRLTGVEGVGTSSAKKHSITGDEGTGGGDWIGGEGIVGDRVTVILHPGNVSSSHSLDDVSLMLYAGYC